MREIKFRMWQKSTYTMFHHANILYSGAINAHNKGEIILMQYTGLKDKNGVEIYEGDILYIDNSRICTRDVKGRVVFEYGCFNVVDDKNIYYTFCEMGESIISIIGNIHENPELIK